jgi:hypothetical protein
MLIEDAILDFSRRTSQPTQTTIAVVDGTATYTLPDDFLLLISFKQEDSCSYQYAWETGAYGWPTWGYGYGYSNYCDPCNERYTIRGGTLTINPTPEHSETRVLRYGWQHVLNDTDTYPYLDSEAARIVLLRAQAEVLRQQATIASQTADITDYSQGDLSVKVDADKLAKSLHARGMAAEQEYDRRVSRYNELASGWCG